MSEHCIKPSTNGWPPMTRLCDNHRFVVRNTHGVSRGTRIAFSFVFVLWERRRAERRASSFLTNPCVLWGVYLPHENAILQYELSLTHPGLGSTYTDRNWLTIHADSSTLDGACTPRRNKNRTIPPSLIHGTCAPALGSRLSRGRLAWISGRHAALHPRAEAETWTRPPQWVADP